MTDAFGNSEEEIKRAQTMFVDLLFDRATNNLRAFRAAVSLAADAPSSVFDSHLTNMAGVGANIIRLYGIDQRLFEDPSKALLFISFCDSLLAGSAVAALESDAERMARAADLKDMATVFSGNFGGKTLSELTTTGCLRTLVRPGMQLTNEMINPAIDQQLTAEFMALFIATGPEALLAEVRSVLNLDPTWAPQCVVLQDGAGVLDTAYAWTVETTSGYAVALGRETAELLLSASRGDVVDAEALDHATRLIWHEGTHAALHVDVDYFGKALNEMAAESVASNYRGYPHLKVVFKCVEVLTGDSVAHTVRSVIGETKPCEELWKRLVADFGFAQTFRIARLSPSLGENNHTVYKEWINQFALSELRRVGARSLEAKVQAGCQAIVTTWGEDAKWWVDTFEDVLPDMMNTQLREILSAQSLNDVNSSITPIGNSATLPGPGVAF